MIEGARTQLHSDSEAWPALHLSDWSNTCATLHMWSQIVGKVRLALSPRVNHWWEVPFYVSARGLTTSPIPYGGGVFEVGFDFIDHQLTLATCNNDAVIIPLSARTVSDFYFEFLDALRALEIEVKIWPMPVEIANPIRFDQDRIHHDYDPEYAHRFWRILVSVDSVFKEFRSRFIGKVSPVHFFWGSFDLAVTRFSGRRAPERPDADRVTREAYSHEAISVGFWPGGGAVKDTAFYAYGAPEPPGYGKRPVRPMTAYYSQEMREFFLMYENVRTSESPKRTLLEFCQTTYEAGADLAGWDRANLERPF
jgi:Family of unknown function (DUF5996)